MNKKNDKNSNNNCRCSLLDIYFVSGERLFKHYVILWDNMSMVGILSIICRSGNWHQEHLRHAKGHWSNKPTIFIKCPFNSLEVGSQRKPLFFFFFAGNIFVSGFQWLTFHSLSQFRMHLSLSPWLTAECIWLDSYKIGNAPLATLAGCMARWANHLDAVLCKADLIIIILVVPIIPTVFPMIVMNWSQSHILFS